MIASCDGSPTGTQGATGTGKPYSLPKEIALRTAAERSSDGKIYIVGSTNLPPGTKIGVSLLQRRGLGPQDYDVFVKPDGKFRSQGFANDGMALPAGEHRVEVISYFNEAWQPPAILEIVGEGGTQLTPGKLIKLDDPSLIDSDKHLDVIQTVNFPKAGPEAKAIETAKNAVLIVDGEKSSMDLGKSVGFFMHGFSGLHVGQGWSARKVGPDTYEVAFDFVNGDRGNEKALWRVDTSTRKVTILNKNAKYFSFVPRD